MKWRTLLTLTAASLSLPMAANAAPLDLAVNNLQESQPAMFQLAQNYGKQFGIKARGGMAQLLQQLDLTPEQSRQIEAIQQQSRAQNESLHREVQQQRAQTRSLFTSNAAPERLRQQHEQTQNLQQQLSDNLFETMLQVREVLTPEQRSQLAELMAQRRDRMRGFY